jgi:hypothetical protein
MQNDQNDITQLNLALEQRNAGRDYNEFFIPGSIKLILATWPKAKLDRTALENERLFAYRFGFDATRAVRQQVIDFQDKHDFSDLEIHRLNRASHLRTTRAEQIIDPSRLMPIAGWIQLTILSLVCVSAILLLEFAPSPEWKRSLGQVVVGGVWFIGGIFLFSYFVAPWQMLKLSGAIKKIGD